MKNIFKLFTLVAFAACAAISCNKELVEQPLLELDRSNMKMNIGQSQKLNASLKGAEAEFEWKSTDADVVSVTGDGEVTAVAAGTAKIVVSAAGQTSECEVVVVDFTAAIEILKDEKGNAAGAVLMNMETKELMVAKAKVVIIATGGAGRMHYQGFPTSNHYGATADGLVLAYRAGAKLMYQDSLQYHPTGTAYPSQILGALVTEKVRSLGAKLVNAKGEVYIHPLETRDVNASGIIRQCREGNGIETEIGQGVWLDTPMIEAIHGEGTIEKRIPAMLRMFGKYGIDIRKEPILVYPTLHYQNGGVEIDSTCHSGVANLLVAGEAAGGIHGTNRLMGNSLLDVVVFGREAGIEAGKLYKDIQTPGKLNMNHVDAFCKERESAKIEGTEVSPKLLPSYARKN